MLLLGVMTSCRIFPKGPSSCQATREHSRKVTIDLQYVTSTWSTALHHEPNIPVQQPIPDPFCSQAVQLAAYTTLTKHWNYVINVINILLWYLNFLFYCKRQARDVLL